MERNKLLTLAAVFWAKYDLTRDTTPDDEAREQMPWACRCQVNGPYLTGTLALASSSFGPGSPGGVLCRPLQESLGLSTSPLVSLQAQAGDDLATTLMTWIFARAPSTTSNSVLPGSSGVGAAAAGARRRRRPERRAVTLKTFELLHETLELQQGQFL